MCTPPELTVIIAVSEGEANLTELLDRITEVGEGKAEFIFCVAGSVPHILRSQQLWRILQADSLSLVPHLWRDGILAGKSERIALTTAQFLPPKNWIDNLLTADLDSWVAIGGPIENDPAPNTVRWAVYFLRYIKFAPPAFTGTVKEIAADNAIYRRSEILKYSDLLKEGFWEPSFHYCFHRAGQRLGLDQRLLTYYKGHHHPGRFMVQRYAHGREFGYSRSQNSHKLVQLIYLVAAPLVPLVLLSKIAGRTFKRWRYLPKLFRSLPWLILFCIAWSVGEARGYLDALRASPGKRSLSRVL